MAQSIFNANANVITKRRYKVSNEKVFIANFTELTVRKLKLNDLRSPILTKKNLFERDLCVCLYCGNRFRPKDLQINYVTPLAQGGAKQWTNAVTACQSCHQRKSVFTPEQANMKLLSIPYEPCMAEYKILSKRNVKIDQMVFLYRKSNSRLLIKSIARFSHSTSSRDGLSELA